MGNVERAIERATRHDDVPMDMAFVPGGTFRTGSDRHYPEEAPAHRVTVDGFWIDRTPVTNRQFRTSASHVGLRCIKREGSDASNTGG